MGQAEFPQIPNPLECAKEQKSDVKKIDRVALAG